MLEDTYKRSYPSIYRGVVESNIDPENLGRCKIRVPYIHGELTYSPDSLPWARPLVLSPVKKSRGSVNIPDKGDIVWVLFEGAVKEFPIYLGGTYAKEEISVSTDIVDFYIEGKDKISYDRKNRSYTISSGGNEIIVSPTGISLKGNVSVSGNLQVSGDIRTSKVNLNTHTHMAYHGETSAPL